MQPLIQWVPAIKWPGCEDSTHVHIVPKLRMHEVVPLLPHLHDVVIS